MKKLIHALLFVLLATIAISAQTASTTTYPEKAPDDPVKARLIPANAKVFIAPSGEEDTDKPQAEGFQNYLAAAFRKKDVKLVIVADRSQADFEIQDTASSKGAGLAKKFILGDFRKSTTASLEVVNLKTGVVAFADSSDRASANRGLRSAAEKLAKYLKKKMDEDAKH
jgi:hypothetical protein